jgi:Mrp family chromosome partitioning ATPase/capsular polysaccharide biosynthesis protein
VSAFEERGTNPTGYINALREQWLLVAAIVVLTVGFAFVFTKLSAKRYEARADVLVTPLATNDETFVGFSLPRESTDPSRSVLTAARLVKTPQVADAVKARLHLKMSRRALLDAVAVDPIGQANILSIGANSPRASEAARIANAFAGEFMRQQTQRFQTQLVQRLDRLRSRLHASGGERVNEQEITAIQGQLATLSPLVGESDPTLHLATRAVPPDAPAWPRPVLTITVALFASLLLGVGAALARETFNPRITREDELLFAHQLPVLARVPQMGQKQVHDYLAGRRQLPGEAWDAYRMLRANLATVGPSGGFPRTILITSAIRGEGKTMSTVNLAIMLANAGVRVVALDGDLRHPMLARVFGVALRGNGLAEVFRSDAPLKHVLVPAPGYGDMIRLVRASPDDAHLVDLLEPNRLVHGLERLKQQADVILVDSPALTEVADALPLADAVEAVIIATRLGHTRRTELSELRRMLSYRGIAPIGLIVTTRRRRGSYYVTRNPERIVKPVPEPATTRPLKADADRG